MKNKMMLDFNVMIEGKKVHLYVRGVHSFNLRPDNTLWIYFLQKSIHCGYIDKVSDLSAMVCDLDFVATPTFKKVFH